MKQFSGWRVIPVCVFAILVFFLWRGLSLDPQKLPSVQIGSPLPKFNLPLLANETHYLNDQAFLGQVSLLNVWASWCQACVDEQWFLTSLKNQGIAIFGVNYKDTPEQAQKWLNEWGNPYKLIGQDKDGKLAIDLGVYGAPETYLIDKNGIIRYRHVGILDEHSWQKEFLPRIEELSPHE